MAILAKIVLVKLLASTGSFGAWFTNRDGIFLFKKIKQNIIFQ